MSMFYVSSRSLRISVVASAAFFAITSAQAVTVTGDISVNDPPAATETKIYLDLNASTASGTGHVGSQGGDPGTPPISFVTDVNAKFANGFADISALDSVITTLTVSVPTGWFFTDLEFSTHKAGDVSITAKNGATIIGTASATGLGNGEVGWLVQAINSKEFTSLVLTSAIDGFDQIKQFEISGLAEACTGDCNGGGPGLATPLPAALPLFAGGLGVMGLLGWRKKRKAAAAAA
jgi:hypothetical protein